MKILAIRGKNLASLAGEFGVDFEQAPLATAGLFAISGPTGAGKSTLLDALCLALYDKTPRLHQVTSSGARLQDVGAETVMQHDVRNLLRRGCAEGYAEVDFVGGDRQSYRARWSVRRARGKADGKLQASEMTLICRADQQRIGGVKTEVLEAIQQRIGLSFNQFTRAVLLAQNEFGVFLKAPDDERATLLETLTGTDQYSQISIRAFERAKLEKYTLEQLQARLTEQLPLDTAAREELEEKLKTLAQAIESNTQRKTALEAQLQWHRRYRDLQKAEQEAQGQWESVQREDSQAQPRRERLALIEALQDARPLSGESDRLAGECEEALQNLSRAETALTEAETAAQAGRAVQQQAQQQRDEAERHKAAALPELNKARQLDAEIETLKPAHAQQQRQWQEAGQALDKIKGALAGKAKENHAAAAAREQVSIWLNANAHLETLSRQWPRWEALFVQGRETLARLQTAGNMLAASEHELVECRRQAEAAATQVEQLRGDSEQAEQTQKTLAQEAAAFDTAALLESNRGSQERLERLRTAEAVWRRLLELQSAHGVQSEKLQGLTESRQRQSAERQALRQELPNWIARHEQAGKMFDLAWSACSQNVEQMRATLRDDEACPVCGSLQHPFADNRHPYRDQLDALEREVAACLERRKQGEQQDSRLGLSLEQHDKQIAELKTDLAATADQIGQQQIQWHAQPLKAELAAREAAAYPNWFASQIAASEAQQQKIAAELQAMTKVNARLTAARQRFEVLFEKRNTVQKQFDAAGEALKQAEFNRQTAAATRQSAAEQLDRQLAELDVAFADAGWRQDWISAPEDFASRCSKQAQHWQDQQNRQLQLAAEIVVFETELKALTGNLGQADAQVSTAQTAFAAIDRELAGKKTARAALFDGQAVSAIETRLEQNISGAKKRFEAAAEAAAQNQTRLATCREAREQAQHQWNTRQAQLGRAQQALSAWLAAFNQAHAADKPIEAADLREILQQNRSEIAAERLALDTLKEALTGAQSVLSERRRQCEAHLETRASLDTEDALQLQLSELQSQLAAEQNQRTELDLQRRADEARIKASSELQAQIGTQAAVSDTWGKLGALIGSADGKKFRNIAQQLTLDILLGYANQHLKDLSRRYRLERVKDTLALQVVDQDMGDEIRSVHSLSGGESFLLSLALALGLASLSSNRVKVESLFIDEGFGSLDAETLRVAMDALDTLQSLGRKVGVISHVQEMTERIGVRIQVRRVSGGSSHVDVQGV